MSSRQNWSNLDGVKVNNEVLADLQAKGLVIVMGEDGYPWVANIRPQCPSCGLMGLPRFGGHRT
ncbi:hypothetical protein SAMN05444354_107348 [Stigmatella aurantiaca]|uniref:Uncharacterized protein n=1 Tax=Stigmatella aurantiaca TaxID=41 RepID=A0A1H7S778_STIAU|nr:hypothetical protein [Stigmatella aurantiaca]SEL68511.1 hypothetical protein SAMN05444354_107348 [Stigmatella aurantiaca]